MKFVLASPTRRRRILVRSLALPAVVLLGLGTTACGGVRRGVRPTSTVISSVAASGGSVGTTASSIAPAGRYLNDGDAEKIDDHDPDNRSANHEDHDADSSEEYEETFDNGSYRDSDDGPVLGYGHAANRPDEQAIAAVVKRYYALAAAADGAQACSTLSPATARAAPETYGQIGGPAYLRGAKTCEAIMSRLFSHFHSRLRGAVAVTGVRVKGDSALALVGSSTMSASEISLTSQRGGWKITSLISQALQ